MDYSTAWIIAGALVAQSLIAIAGYIYIERARLKNRVARSSGMSAANERVRIAGHGHSVNVSLAEAPKSKA